MIEYSENIGLMPFTETLDRKEYTIDLVGVFKKYTYTLFYVRTVFVIGRSVILRLRGLL